MNDIALMVQLKRRFSGGYEGASSWRACRILVLFVFRKVVIEKIFNVMVSLKEKKKSKWRECLTRVHS